MIDLLKSLPEKGHRCFNDYEYRPISILAASSTYESLTGEELISA